MIFALLFSGLSYITELCLALMLQSYFS